MVALRLDGKVLARKIEARLKALVMKNKIVAGRTPGLAVLRVGNDPASGVYVANKEKACFRIGLATYGIHLDSETPAEEVLRCINRLNDDPRVDGILLQLPLPDGLLEAPLLHAIDPEKDADGLHTINLGRLLKGERGLRSCTPAGVMVMLKSYGIETSGKRAVVVGRSILVGQPMALMLQAANSTVTVTHSRTLDIASHTRQAEIIVVATGRSGIIGAEHVSPGAVVVDVGIHRKPEGGLCGDVLAEDVEPIVYALSPVPGGVGPMTVIMLMVNTVVSWCRRHGIHHELDDLIV